MVESFIEQRGDDVRIKSELAAAYGRAARISAVLGDPERAHALIADALRVQTQIADETKTVESKLSLADLYRDLGKFEHSNSQLDRADVAFQSAVEILDELIGNEPENAKLLLTRIELLNDVTRMSHATRRWQDALTVNNRTLESAQKLVERLPESIDALSALSDCWYVRGLIKRDLVVSSEAEEAFKKSIACYKQIQSRVLTQQGDRSGMQDRWDSQVAACWHALGITQRKQGDLDGAAESHRQAATIRELLTRRNPGVIEYRGMLAMTLNSLATVHLSRDDLDQSLEWYGRAVAVQQRLVEDVPEIPRHHSDLAMMHSNVGIVHRRRGDMDQALSAYQQAISIQQALAKETPEDIANRVTLGRSLWNLGKLFHTQDNFEAALEWYDKSATDFLSLHKEIRSDPDIEFFLGKSETSKAECLMDLKSYPAAAESWKLAIRFTHGVDVAFRRVQLARCLLLGGDSELGAQEASRVIEEGVSKSLEIDDETRYDAACVFALAAAAAAEQTGLTIDQRNELVERHAKAALAALNGAKANGWFDDAERVAHLQQDPDLTALRERPEFVAFVASLKAPE